ncbi:MAG: oligosaccharide flippase family protein [Anaerolineae bacterium]|nr:oligosaccharide flippase family protein [Anaerolineae bacterium]
MKFIEKILQGILHKQFAQNTLWVFSGMILKTGTQIFYFIIIARTLAPENYGVFSGALAFVLVFSSFASWGSDQILIKHVARQTESFSEYWGMALGVSLVSSIFIGLIATAIGLSLFSAKIVIQIILPIIIGIFLGEKLSLLSSYAFLAHQKMILSSLTNTIPVLYRMISALIFLIIPTETTAESWAILYMSSGILSGLTGLLFVKKLLGWGKITISPMQGKWREGFFFSIGISAQSTYNDIDKTILLRIGSATDAGLYAAAYRMIDSAFIPIRAILTTAYPRFFKEGVKGMQNAHKFSLRLLPWAIGTSFLASIGIIIISPLLPKILGEQYSLTAQIIIWLSPLIIIRTFHYLIADTITGAGYQGQRSGIQIGIAIINVLLNIIWIPQYGWLGAVWSSLISDLLLAVALWAFVAMIKKKGD